MRMFDRLKIFLLGMGFSCLPVIGSYNYFAPVFQEISIADGLSNNRISQIIQDTTGYIWIGTLKGLNRYDGYEFKRYISLPEDSQSLSSSVITSLFVDRSGKLWVGTEGGGLNAFEETKNKFIRYLNDPDNPQTIISNWVNCITEDREKNLWIGTRGGISVFNTIKNKFIASYRKGRQSGDLKSDYVKSIKTDSRGIIWIATFDGGLYRYDDQRNRFISYQHSSNESDYKKKNKLSSICIDRNDVIWVGSYGRGLGVFNFREDKVEFPVDREPFISLYDKKILSLMEDREGNLWIGEEGSGVYIYLAKQDTVLHYSRQLSDPTNMKYFSINNIYEDRTGVIWIGTSFAGISKTDLMPRKFRHYQNYSNNGHFGLYNDVNGIYVDTFNHVWASGVEGLSYINQKTGAIQGFRIPGWEERFGEFPSVYAITGQKDKYLWIGTSGGIIQYDLLKESYKIIRLTTDTAAMEENKITAMHLDFEGMLWVGLWKKGLYRYNPYNNTFKHFSNVANEALAPSSDLIWSIYDDGEGKIWLSTAHCLNYYDKYTRTFKHLRQIRTSGPIFEDNEQRIWIGGYDQIYRINKTGEVLFNKDLNIGYVASMLVDGSLNVWLGTRNGFYKYNTIENRLQMFALSDGLQSYEFSRNASAIDMNGTYYFGGINGVNAFIPEDITTNTAVPSVVLTELKINNQIIEPFVEGSPLQKPLYLTKYIRLEYHQNLISLKVSALHFSAPEKNSYAYRLIGKNSEWQALNNNRVISLGELKPGHYTLEVKASNNDQVWNEKPTVLQIHILGPFWKSLWFKISLFLLAFLLVYIYNYYRFKEHLSRRHELERQVKERTRELEEKTEKLIYQTKQLNEANQILAERQQFIEEQSEEIKVQAEKVKAQSEELTRKNRELDQLNSTKDKLFSIIAHDLKNPISTIMGFSEMIVWKGDDLEPDKRSQYNEIILKSIKDIHNLLENLLDWSRSQTHTIGFNPEPIHINEIIENTLKLLIPSAEKKNIKVNWERNSDLEVIADGKMVTTVVRNLVSNAIKYTNGEGTIDIKTDHTRDFCRIEIRDNGIGITDEKSHNLFNLEALESTRGTDGESGTGLGLILCKEFVERNGGIIGVESKPQLGSKFWFTLPLNKKMN